MRSKRLKINCTDKTVDGLKSCFFDRYPFVSENSRPRILTQKLPPCLNHLKATASVNEIRTLTKLH